MGYHFTQQRKNLKMSSHHLALLRKRSSIGKRTKLEGQKDLVLLNILLKQTERKLLRKWMDGSFVED